MIVSGFTFLRNGTLLGYPFIQSIRSVLPICDEFVVAVGEGDDDTLERLQEMREPKLRIIQTRWNEKMQDRGYVYAQQKMIAHFNCTGDWAFYLEGDEVLHERDIPTIHEVMKRHLDDKNVEAIAFDYLHFFGSPDWIATSPGWYRRAPRIIRNSIRSYSPDGLFFVVMDRNKKGRYPRAALAGVPIYHYGHVRSISAMREKNQRIGRYWGTNHSLFNGYVIDPQALTPFTGDHPEIVREWLGTEAEQSYIPNTTHTLTRRELRHRVLMKIERWFDVELTKKHYRQVD
jgi:hypothetical protein